MSECTNIYNRYKMNSRITDGGYFDPEGYEYDTREVIACHDCMFHIYHDSCMLYEEQGFDKDRMREQYKSVWNNKYCDYFLMKDFSEGSSEDEEIRSEVMAIAKRKNYPSEYWARVASSSSSSNNGSGCFPKGTLISVKNSKKCISTLRKGDLVTTYNNKNEELLKRILNIKRYKNKTLWQLSFSDGSKLSTTGSHSFLRNGKWIKASKLSLGDKVVCFMNRRIVEKEIIDSHDTNQVVDVFNIIVEDNFTFVADGVLSHSFTHFRHFREIFWSLYSFMDKHKVLIHPISNHQLKGE